MEDIPLLSFQVKVGRYSNQILCSDLMRKMILSSEQHGVLPWVLWCTHTHTHMGSTFTHADIHVYVCEPHQTNVVPIIYTHNCFTSVIQTYSQTHTHTSYIILPQCVCVCRCLAEHNRLCNNNAHPVVPTPHLSECQGTSCVTDPLSH